MGLVNSIDRFKYLRYATQYETDQRMVVRRILVSYSRAPLGVYQGVRTQYAAVAYTS